MSTMINAETICDEPGCDAYHSDQYRRLPTVQAIVAQLREAGWSVSGSLKRGLRSRCPDHARRRR